MNDTQRQAIDLLKAMDTVTVPAAFIAPVLGVSPGVLRKHVKDGDYLISKVDICGNRIRFFRKDFLQKIGEIPPDPPEKTVREQLDEISFLLSQILYEIKTAGAATPTD